MKRALCTFGVGRHAEYMAISRPLFQEYAERHGYTYVERYIASKRPPSWSKVLLLLELLTQYDEALWIDSDVIAVDVSADVSALLPPWAMQALSILTTHLGVDLGQLPSAGFWYVRRAMIAALEEIWAMSEYVSHPWWEQAALQDLLGYVRAKNGPCPAGHELFPVMPAAPTALRRKSYILPADWHSLDLRNPRAQVRFMHITGVSHVERLYLMRFWAERARSSAYAES